MVNILKKLDEHTKQVLAKDKELVDFWSNYFSNKEESYIFIQNCLKKLFTKKMMLIVKWYIDIADGMPKVRDSRPALQVVFLVAIAETIARRKFTKQQAGVLGSKKLVLNFFKYITDYDKNEFKKSLKKH